MHDDGKTHTPSLPLSRPASPPWPWSNAHPLQCIAGSPAGSPEPPRTRSFMAFAWGDIRAGTFSARYSKRSRAPRQVSKRAPCVAAEASAPEPLSKRGEENVSHQSSGHRKRSTSQKRRRLSMRFMPMPMPVPTRTKTIDRTLEVMQEEENIGTNKNRAREESPSRSSKQAIRRWEIETSPAWLVEGARNTTEREAGRMRLARVCGKFAEKDASIVFISGFSRPTSREAVGRKPTGRISRDPLSSIAGHDKRARIRGAGYFDRECREQLRGNEAGCLKDPQG